jgi:hypothetical protein
MAAKTKKQLDSKATPRSVRDVSRFFAQSGIEDVRLERGRGFFYFIGVPVHNWLNRAVVSPDLGSRTLGQWLEEYRRMAKQNAGRDPFGVPTTRQRKKNTSR